MTYTMARLIAASLLIVAFVAAVEGRDDHPIVPHDTSLMGDSSFVFRKLTGEDECQRTCDHVHFNTMCRSLTRLPGVSTPRELLQAAVQAAMGKAKLAKSRVDEYAAISHEGNPMASILQTCSEAYSNVAQALVETQQLIDAHATQHELMSQVSAVNTYAIDCDNAFEERLEIRSPFMAVQRNVYRLVDNVLNIAHVIKQV